MIELQKGDLVRSTAGHDKGALLLVIEVAGDRAAVADGRTRKLSKPKEKNRKHLRFVGRTGLAGLPESDATVRALLARFATE